MSSTGYNTHYHTAYAKWKNFKLPYANKPYIKGRVQWNQSVATYRNSERSVSFTREQRFRSTMPYCQKLGDLNLTLEMSRKSAPIGSGKKVPISEIVLKNAEIYPAPNLYDITHNVEETRKAGKGHKFVAGREQYEKVYVDHRKDVYSPHFTKDHPSFIYNSIISLLFS